MTEEEARAHLQAMRDAHRWALKRATGDIETWTERRETWGDTRQPYAIGMIAELRDIARKLTADIAAMDLILGDREAASGGE